MIGGWQKISLVDYPGHVCTTLFIAGCNLRCPYCHNPSLVMPGVTDGHRVEAVLDFLHKRRGLIDSVTISGGEPTLAPALPGLMSRLKAAGVHIKLDSNGTRPEVLQQLIEQHLVDFVALDVKAPPEKYALVAGVTVNAGLIKESVRSLAGSAVPYELRTTVSLSQLDTEDLIGIGRWLQGAHRYVLQACRAGTHLDPHFQARAPSREWLLNAQEKLSGLFDRVLIRGATLPGSDTDGPATGGSGAVSRV